MAAAAARVLFGVMLKNGQLHNEDLVKKRSKSVTFFYTELSHAFGECDEVICDEVSGLPVTLPPHLSKPPGPLWSKQPTDYASALISASNPQQQVLFSDAAQWAGRDETLS